MDFFAAVQFHTEIRLRKFVSHWLTWYDQGVCNCVLYVLPVIPYELVKMEMQAVKEKRITRKAAYVFHTLMPFLQAERLRRRIQKE